MTTATLTPVKRRGGRLAVVTAIAGTVFIACGAFWLSFTALADLARRSGIGAEQAWAWPLIVDGIIVTATVAVVALAGTRSAWYPWLLLGAGAVVSVTANAIHAVVAADSDVPDVLAASVAAVPPLVLLAITHLTVILTRPVPTPVPAPEPASSPALAVEADLPSLVGESVPVPPMVLVPETPEAPEPRGEVDGREVAEVLHAAGWSNRRIADHLGVHKSTVGRWFPRPAPAAVGEAAGDAPVGHEPIKEPRR
jgi:hypothetical protein